MFPVSNTRTTWLIYAATMTLVAGFAFGNLLTQNFWDGADDESILSDIVMLSQNLSLIISPTRGHDARPPFDLVILGGYILWGEIPLPSTPSTLPFIYWSAYLWP